MKLLAMPVLLLVFASLATAQWSPDPRFNLAVSDAIGDQVQPKIAPTTDGGCYVSWFDSIGNGYDVRLQKLDVDGNELWAHDGILVFDRSLSWTQDYGLDVDAAGNALLAFRDDSSTAEQITAARVSPLGQLLWGASGVRLTNTTEFVAAPKIAGTSDGGAVVAWTQGSSTKLQKLDVAGAPQWGPGITLTPGVGNYSVSDLHDSGTDVILSMVYVTGMFFDPKHLLAQKLDATGSPQWGANPLAIYDGGSLQFGNYPPFVPDGGGGAVFSWYDPTPLQCYAQHVRADGSEAFPHNGVAGSTNTAQARVDPSVAYDPATGSTYMFWTEQNSSQSVFGLSGQKFDASGVRQWTDGGSTLIPIGAPEIRQVSTAVDGTGSFVFWTHIPSFATDTLIGAHVDVSGAFDVGPFDVASVPSVKSRLDVETGTSGQVLLAWSDQRTDGGDILAQNVELAASCSWYCGTGANAATDGFTITTPATLGGTLVASVASCDPGNAGALLVGYATPFTYLSAWGEVLVDFTDPAGELLGIPTALGSPAPFQLTVPGDPSFYGLVFYTQAASFGGAVCLHCAYECMIGF